MVAYRRLDAAKIAQIHVLRKVKTLSRAEIARLVGVSGPTVSYWASRECPSEPESVPTRAVKSWKSVKSRRNRVKALAMEKISVKHRTRRLYQGARAICAALQRKYDIAASPSTVRRDLRAIGWRYYSRRPCAQRGPADLKARREFARAYAKINALRMLLSDEKTFTCADATTKKEWAPCRGDATHHDNSSTAQDNVYVWGCIGINFRHLVVIRKAKTGDKAKRKRNGEERPAGECFTSDTYIERCLNGKVIEHLKKKTSTGQTRLLQQDGHRSHTSKKVYDHLDGENVSYIADWPARSPDLNPIENLWAWLAKRVSEDVPQNADELEESIRKHWNGMPNSFVNSFVMSFTGKCQRVAQRGGFTA